MKVTFEFPDDAWDGVVASLTEHSYQAFVPNPEYQASPSTEPQQIPNPVTRDQAAYQVVLEFIAQRYKDWGRRQALAPVQTQVNAAVDSRAAEVIAATKVVIE